LAYDEDDAEIEARTAMINQKIDEMGLTGAEALQYVENADDPANFGGSMISWTGGVKIFAAANFLEAGEKLLAEVKSTGSYEDALAGEDNSLMAAVSLTERAIVSAKCESSS
jgi:hypothetical protein